MLLLQPNAYAAHLADFSSEQKPFALAQEIFMQISKTCEHNYVWFGGGVYLGNMQQTSRPQKKTPSKKTMNGSTSGKGNVLGNYI